MITFFICFCVVFVMVAVWSAVTRFYIENHDPVTYAPELQHLKRPHNQKWWYYLNPYYSKWRHP